MFTECNAEIVINSLDNGYTVKWEKKRDKEASDQEYFGPRGFEIVSGREELLARIAELIK